MYLEFTLEDEKIDMKIVLSKIKKGLECWLEDLLSPEVGAEHLTQSLNVTRYSEKMFKNNFKLLVEESNFLETKMAKLEEMLNLLSNICSKKADI